MLHRTDRTYFIRFILSLSLSLSPLDRFRFVLLDKFTITLISFPPVFDSLSQYSSKLLASHEEDERGNLSPFPMTSEILLGWQLSNCGFHNLIKAIIDSDRHSTTREIAEKLHVLRTRIENRLKQLGYVEKLDTWVPHELKEKHLTQRVNSCDLLKKRNENDPFLKRPITGDEKWVVYNDIERKRWWSRPREPARTTSKAGIRRKKVLLSV